MSAPALFVVSTGRTGTTFLASAFTELGITALHEPGPLSLQRASHRRASGHLGDDAARALLEAARGSVLAATDVPYLEASMHLYGLVDAILDLWPQARVVHVVRDPRTYVRSAMIWGVHRWDGRPRNIVPYRRLAPSHERPFDPWIRFRWSLTSQFERVCWTWAAMNRATRLQGAGHDRFRTVRFEDLFDPDAGVGVLGRMCDDLSIAPAPDRLAELIDTQVNPSSRKEGRIHPSRRTDYPRWEEWSERRRAVLVRHCAEEAAHHGYDLST